MFYDERIVIGRGKAYRNTIILATVLMTLLTISDIMTQCLLLKKYNPLFSVVSLVTAIAGIAIIIFGEKKYGRIPEDERVEGLKSQYYSKAFYVFINVLACAYSIALPLIKVENVPHSIGNSEGTTVILGMNFVLENCTRALSIVEFPCLIFLLYQMKSQYLPINASVIEEDGSTYWKKVWGNILRFAAKCGIYTLISLFISVIFSVFNFGGYRYSPIETIMGIWYMVGILAAGLEVFIGFSVEYLIFSVVDRISEQAKGQDALSHVTTVFFSIGAWSAAVSALFSTVLRFSTTVTLLPYVTRVMQFGENLAFLSFGICMAYLLSELKGKVGDSVLKGIKLVGMTQVVIYIVNMIFSVFSNGFIEFFSFRMDDGVRKLLDIIMMIKGGFLLSFEIAACITVLVLISRLTQEKLTSMAAIFIPIFSFLVNGINIYMTYIFGSPRFLAFFACAEIAGIAMYGFLFFNIFKKIKDKMEKSIEK